MKTVQELLAYECLLWTPDDVGELFPGLTQAERETMLRDAQPGLMEAMHAAGLSYLQQRTRPTGQRPLMTLPPLMFNN